MKIDLHNHTKYCNHANGTKDEYIEQAINVGLNIFGFPCHAPMEFDKDFRMTFEEQKEYENQLLILKDRYKDKCEILIGYEVDFLEGYMEDCVLNSDSDYLIGSVHFLDNWGIDNPESIFEYSKRDIDDVWLEYLDLIRKMSNTNKFNIVGHLDLVKIFNHLPTKSIKDSIIATLESIKNHGMVIEINASGLRKPIQEQYPSKEILELAFDFDIPITFGSDSHNVSHIGYKREYLENLAKSIGYTKCALFRKKELELIPF